MHLLLDTLNGGIDTTQSALAHGVRLFAAHPDQWPPWRRRPSLAPRAVDEILRFEPVAPFTTRVLLEDVEHRDIIFPTGTVVFASAWNANREAEGDDRPEEFDITADRGSAKPLTFGAGPHFCMGANLARAELQEGLAFLAPTCARSSWTASPCTATITGLYGMQSLPVRWGAAALDRLARGSPAARVNRRSSGYTSRSVRLVHRGGQVKASVGSSYARYGRVGSLLLAALVASACAVALLNGGSAASARRVARRAR